MHYGGDLAIDDIVLAGKTRNKTVRSCPCKAIPGGRFFLVIK